MKYVTSLEEEERRKSSTITRLCFFVSALALYHSPTYRHHRQYLMTANYIVAPEDSQILDTTAPTTLPLLATSVARVILADWSLPCQSEISAHPIGCGN